MTTLLVILAVSLGGLAAGYLCKVFCGHTGFISFERLNLLSGRLKTIALLYIYPIAIINSFWKLAIADVRLLIIPAVGLLPLLLGSAVSFYLSRKYKIVPAKAASMYICGMCTNQGVMGGLITFLVLGDQGYFYLQLVLLLELILYYVVGFPVSYGISQGSTKLLHFRLSTLKEQPQSLLPLLAVLVGVILNTAHVRHPGLMDSISAWSIPGCALLTCLAIGMTLQWSSLRNYRTEVMLVLAAKHIVNPLVVLPAAWLLVMNGLLSPLVFQVLIIVNFMPVGYTALLAPVLYKYDLTLANSIWLASMILCIFLFIPILMLIL
ncbi:MAG: hypothetical protein RBT41_11675 [Clostridia bacterium]|nr:hypothetical protein [Clostridia bacterium]